MIIFKMCYMIMMINIKAAMHAQILKTGNTLFSSIANTHNMQCGHYYR